MPVSMLALVQFAMAFRRASSFSLTQASFSSSVPVFEVCSADTADGPLSVDIALVDVSGCEREDEAQLSMAVYGEEGSSNTGSKITADAV